MNLTLSIDSNLLKEARKAAIEKDTTVNALVRNYLEEYVKQKNAEKDSFLEEWRLLMDKNSIDMSARSWTRDQLHER